MLKVLYSTYGLCNVNYEWYVKRSCPYHCHRIWTSTLSWGWLASVSKFRNLVYAICKCIKTWRLIRQGGNSCNALHWHDESPIYILLHCMLPSLWESSRACAMALLDEMTASHSPFEQQLEAIMFTRIPWHWLNRWRVCINEHNGSYTVAVYGDRDNIFGHLAGEFYVLPSWSMFWHKHSANHYGCHLPMLQALFVWQIIRVMYRIFKNHGSSAIAMHLNCVLFQIPNLECWILRENTVHASYSWTNNCTKNCASKFDFTTGTFPTTFNYIIYCHSKIGWMESTLFTMTCPTCPVCTHVHVFSHLVSITAHSRVVQMS